MEDPIVKKILPHSYEAEQAVIGSMIMDPDAVPIAMELINKDDFFLANRKSPLQQDISYRSGRKKPADRIILLDFYLPEAY